MEKMNIFKSCMLACGLDYKSAGVLLNLKKDTIRKISNGTRKYAPEHLNSFSALRLKQLNFSRFVAELWKSKNRPKILKITVYNDDEAAILDGWPSKEAHEIALGMAQCVIVPSVIEFTIIK